MERGAGFTEIGLSVERLSCRSRSARMLCMAAWHFSVHLTIHYAVATTDLFYDSNIAL